jgi:transcriptional regulator with XRE-family HTH domain
MVVAGPFLESNMDKDLAVTLGNAARQARKARKLTQERVAEQLDVSVEFYSRIERGLAHPSTHTFVRMLSVLAVSADTLFGLDVAHQPAEAHALISPDDPPEVRRLVAILRTARPSTLRLVSALLNEFDRVSTQRRRTGRPPPHGPPPESLPDVPEED